MLLQKKVKTGNESMCANRSGSRYWSVVILLILLFQPPHVHGEEELARQLMLESGLVSQLNLLYKSLSLQLDYTLKQDKKLRQLSEDKKRHIMSWLRTSYSPERLITSIQAYYYESLSDQDMQQILRWIRSSTGNRFTEMEKMATGSYAEQAMKLYKASHPLQQFPENRRKLISRLNKVTKVSESALVVKLTAKLASALIEQQGSRNKQSVADLMKDIGRQRDELMQEIMPDLIPDMLYMYRDASDLELQSYISFAESSVGVRYHTTLLGAFNNALIEASQDFGHVLLSEY